MSFGENLRPCDGRYIIIYRGGSYLVFAAVLGVSIGVSISLLAVPAVVLFVSSVMYGLAVWKREDVEESFLKGPLTDNN